MAEFNDGMAETRPPQAATVTTDVLIVGSGPAGASAALFLSTLGVDNIMVTKYRWTANTPRAHITNQRTMEVFRDLGIEPDVWAQAVPHELMGETVFCTSLAGDEIGRVRTWGTHPAREADYTMASPSQNCDIPQTLLEPIVVGHAAFDFIETRWGKDGVRRFLGAARRRPAGSAGLYDAAFNVTADEFDRGFEEYLTATFTARPR